MSATTLDCNVPGDVLYMAMAATRNGAADPAFTPFPYPHLSSFTEAEFLCPVGTYDNSPAIYRWDPVFGASPR